MGLFDFTKKKENEKLLQASANGNITLIDESLSNGANKNYKDAKGWTALMFACDQGHAEAVRKLLNAGVDVNSRDEKGATALVYASVKGYVDIMNLLLDADADVNLGDKGNATALIYAASGGQIDAVKTLLSTGKYELSHSGAAMLFSSSYGYGNVVELFLKNGVDVNYFGTDGKTALFMASKSGCIEVIKVLLNHGVNVNYVPPKGITALIAASANGHAEIVKLLLDNGADVNKISEDISALYSASHGGHTDVVKMLIDAGADVNYADNKGYTSLTQASMKGHLDVVKLLLNASADVKDKNDIPAKNIAKSFANQFQGKYAEIFNVLEEYEKGKRYFPLSEQTMDKLHQQNSRRDEKVSSWSFQTNGGSNYYSQNAGSLLDASEILKKLSSIPPQTYYLVDTPDGTLGRDINGFFTEALIKTAHLKIDNPCGETGSVQAQSLMGFGDMLKNQSSVAYQKINGQYAKLVLMMKCGQCGYESPIETVAGEMERQCYNCGTNNKTHRGAISVYTATGTVDV